MKLIVKCQHCRNEISSPHKEATRIKYLQKHGESFHLKCISCQQTHTYEVDDIRAVDYSFGEILANRIIVLVVTVVVVFLASFLLIGSLGAVMLAVISALIYSVNAKKNNAQANLLFNKQKVTGRMTKIGD